MCEKRYKLCHLWHEQLVISDQRLLNISIDRFWLIDPFSEMRLIINLNDFFKHRNFECFTMSATMINLFIKVY